VNILIDAQLPPSLARLLVAAGHQARHVREVGLRDAPDPAIWDYAVREGAVILTKDEDSATNAFTGWPDDPLASGRQYLNRCASELADPAIAAD